MRYVFPTANHVFLEMYAGLTVGGQNAGNSPLECNSPYQPKHYLKQFHPNYVSQSRLAKLVANAGYRNWD